MLVIRDFSKTYKGGNKAVDGLSLHVEPGVIYGFIGHNGAGKTTTIRSVVGAQSFDSGEILICGKSITAEPEEAKRLMAYIPDSPEVYDNLTGTRFLDFVADVYGVGAAERRERITRYGDMFEITPRLGNVISTYSHGMKQKLVLISALIHAPRLLVLDEPFVGLDPKAAFTLKEIMRDMTNDGCAIFFSTHVLDTAEKLCDRVAIIKNGRLVAEGTMDEIRGNESLEHVFLELIDHDA
jgi:ABC-2 type transport system ATP-binding protein